MINTQYTTLKYDYVRIILHIADTWHEPQHVSNYNCLPFGKKYAIFG